MFKKNRRLAEILWISGVFGLLYLVANLNSTHVRAIGFGSMLLITASIYEADGVSGRGWPDMPSWLKVVKVSGVVLAFVCLFAPAYTTNEIFSKRFDRLSWVFMVAPLGAGVLERRSDDESKPGVPSQA